MLITILSQQCFAIAFNGIRLMHNACLHKLFSVDWLQLGKDFCCQQLTSSSFISSATGPCFWSGRTGVLRSADLWSLLRLFMKFSWFQNCRMVKLFSFCSPKIQCLFFSLLDLYNSFVSKMWKPRCIFSHNILWSMPSWCYLLTGVIWTGSS